MTERYYNDGTEPDVLPHFSDRGCCTGMCQQGRFCPQQRKIQDDEWVHLCQRVVDAFAVFGLVAAITFVIGYVIG